jgi:thiol-disulfide isomerase/thioredoxin
MISNLFFLTILLLNQSGQSESAVMRFAKPSEAFAYANAPMEEWMAAIKSGKPPKTRTSPQAEVWRRVRTLCPSFAIENLSGEELYWLAKLCESQPAIGLPAVQRYLAGNGLEHRPEAHLILSVFQMRETGSWEGAWQTLQTILQEDPIGQDQEFRLRAAIEAEADDDERTALRWSEERYTSLRARLRPSGSGISPVAADWVILAGTDLVHRYYLAGNSERAASVLAEINELKNLTPEAIGPWSSQDLNWANMEMKAAPAIPALKAIGASLNGKLIQRGRVELVSFFFLRCAPCITELPELNELQKRFPKRRLLVVGVTTYQTALQPDMPPRKQIESAIEETKRKKSPNLTMVLAPEEVLSRYGIAAFPVAAVIDQAGQLRYIGAPDNFDSGESIDRLIHRLLDDEVPSATRSAVLHRKKST